MSKLDINVLIGAESKAFLVNLTEVVERLEKVTAQTATVGKAVAAATKTTTTKTTAKATEDEEFDLGTDDEETEDTVTINDVISACKANREQAKKVLKKMKLASVHELKPAQYKKVLAEIGAN